MRLASPRVSSLMSSTSANAERLCTIRLESAAPARERVGERSARCARISLRGRTNPVQGVAQWSRPPSRAVRFLPALQTNKRRYTPSRRRHEPSRRRRPQTASCLAEIKGEMTTLILNDAQQDRRQQRRLLERDFARCFGSADQSLITIQGGYFVDRTKRHMHCGEMALKARQDRDRRSNEAVDSTSPAAQFFESARLRSAFLASRENA
jgi:hypothetical protein